MFIIIWIYQRMRQFIDLLKNTNTVLGFSWWTLLWGMLTVNFMFQVFKRIVNQEISIARKEGDRIRRQKQRKRLAAKSAYKYIEERGI